MIISNSSPLIHLTKLGKINHLISKEKQIIIPTAVYNEVVIIGKEKKYAESFIIEKMINNGEIVVKKTGNHDKSLYPFLGEGEIEAIELAKMEEKLVLIDDKKARNVADLLKIEFQTTIVTIFELLLTNYINFSEYKSNITKLAEEAWISADIIQKFIDKGEELIEKNNYNDAR